MSEKKKICCCDGLTEKDNTNESLYYLFFLFIQLYYSNYNFQYYYDYAIL